MFPQNDGIGRWSLLGHEIGASRTVPSLKTMCQGAAVFAHFSFSIPGNSKKSMKEEGTLACRSPQSLEFELPASKSVRSNVVYEPTIPMDFPSWILMAYLAEARIQCLSRSESIKPGRNMGYGKMKYSVSHEYVAVGPQISKQQRTRDGSKATNLLSKHTHSPFSTATKHTGAASKSRRWARYGGTWSHFSFPIFCSSCINPVSVQIASWKSRTPITSSFVKHVSPRATEMLQEDTCEWHL